MRPKWLGTRVIGVSAMRRRRVRLLVAVAEHHQHQRGQRGRLIVAYVEAGAPRGRHAPPGRRRRAPRVTQLGDGGAEARRQLLGEPEVEQADDGARQHEEVPRVRVALEEALLEDHARIQAPDAARDLGQVVARGAKRGPGRSP